MSVELMAEVWTLRLKSGQRDVLLVMADHANDSGICWPSVRRIAWKTDKDPRSVKRSLRELEEIGLVECIANEHGGRGRSRLYRLHLEKGDKKPPFSIEDDEREENATVTSGNTGVQLASNGKGDVSSPIGERVTPTREKGDADARKGDTALSPQPSVTTKEPPSSPTVVEKTPTRDTGKETFEILQLVLLPGRKYHARFRSALAGNVRRELEATEDPAIYHVVLEAARRLVNRNQHDSRVTPAALAWFIQEVHNGSAPRNGARNGHRPFDANAQDYETAEIR